MTKGEHPYTIVKRNTLRARWGTGRALSQAPCASSKKTLHQHLSYLWALSNHAATIAITSGTGHALRVLSAGHLNTHPVCTVRSTRGDILHWGWSRVEGVAEVRLGKQRSPKNCPGSYGRKYVRVANVFSDRLDLSDIKIMDFPPGEFERYRLRKGDTSSCARGEVLNWSADALCGTRKARIVAFNTR